jgi:hypothetical protein
LLPLLVVAGASATGGSSSSPPGTAFLQQLLGVQCVAVLFE